MSDLLDLLLELEDFLDDRSDVRDGPYGEPVPNRAMQLLESVRREQRRLAQPTYFAGSSPAKEEQ